MSPCIFAQRQLLLLLAIQSIHGPKYLFKTLPTGQQSPSLLLVILYCTDTTVCGKILQPLWNVLSKALPVSHDQDVRPAHRQTAALLPGLTDWGLMSLQELIHNYATNKAFQHAFGKQLKSASAYLLYKRPLINAWWRTSLVVECLRLHTSSAGCVGLIPGHRTKSLHATWHGQNFFKKLKYSH